MTDDTRQEAGSAPRGMADRPRLDDFFVEHYTVLVAAARHLTGDTSTAEEVVHTVYERCVPYWSAIREPRFYVARAIVRTAAEMSVWWKREWRKAQRAIGDAPREVRGPDAAELERDRRVNAAVSRLPQRQRECVVLHHYFDFKQVEIAEMLGGHPGSVQQHLLRANRKLRTALGEYSLQRRPGNEEINAARGEI
jgi:RNA polymerase sigma factor (sigma-70 family)